MYRQLVRQTGHFILGIATNLEEGKQDLLCIKLSLCCILPLVERLGNTYEFSLHDTLCLFCLSVFHSISTFVGYLMSNPFYTNKQFYFKQFSLA